MRFANWESRDGMRDAFEGLVPPKFRLVEWSTRQMAFADVADHPNLKVLGIRCSLHSILEQCWGLPF